MNPKNPKKSDLKFNSKIRELTFSALLCGIALTIFVIEAQFPLPIPVPGIKPGFANIVTLFALLYLSPKNAFLILLGRILLGSIFSGNPSVLLYSLSGGVSSLFAELLFLKIFGRKFITEISIVGAIVHNTVQILCAALITKSTAVFAYLPFLIVAALLSGALCGLCILGIDKHFSFGIIKILKKNRR